MKKKSSDVEMPDERVVAHSHKMKSTREKQKL